MTNKQFIAQVLAEFDEEFVQDNGVIEEFRAHHLKNFITHALTASAQNAIESVTPGDCNLISHRAIAGWNKCRSKFLMNAKRYFL